jgi:dihydrofolate synthase/folylpolyglutamate synthase
VAQEQASPLHNLSDEVSIENLSVQKTGSSFSLRFADNRIMQRLFVPIPGAVMATNAAAAILALNIAFKDKITEEAIRKGLSQTFLPGRFEARGNFIIDGAHTPRSTALCLETFEAVFGPGPWPALLFGCAASKDASAMAQLLASRFRHIVITRPGSYLSSRPEEVYAAFQNAAETLKSPKPDITFIEDTERAIVYVQTLLPPQSDIPVLGIGSFYLAGIIRGFTREKPLAPYQSPCSAPGRQSSNG